MLSPSLVSHAYKLVLGRPIESAMMALRLARHYRSSDKLFFDLLNSEEFLAERAKNLELIAVPDIHDLNVLRAFGRYRGAGTPGFVTDFLGIKTDIKFISHLGKLDGKVENYPLPAGNFHGDIHEWIGTLSSVLEADSKDLFTVVELGAGWAPWLVAAGVAARIHKVSRLRLIGLEGASGHAAFMPQHFRNNGLPLEGNDLLHAVVGTADGMAEFPVAEDPSADWAQAALFEESGWKSSGKDYRGLQITKTEPVRVLTLETLLANDNRIDLLHCDIQGHEADVMEHSIDLLNKKVKWAIIGTHGRAIEARLHRLFSADGWELRRDAACRLVSTDAGLELVADGCQVWRNRRLASA